MWVKASITTQWSMHCVNTFWCHCLLQVRRCDVFNGDLFVCVFQATWTDMRRWRNWWQSSSAWSQPWRSGWASLPTPWTYQRWLGRYSETRGDGLLHSWADLFLQQRFLISVFGLPSHFSARFTLLAQHFFSLYFLPPSHFLLLYITRL